MSPSRPIRITCFALLLSGALLGGAAHAGGSTSATTTTAAPAPAAADSAKSADDKHAAADVQTKRLLTLMDTDKSGKVSKQEFMSYMEAEFDRLDVNKDGELDVAELTKLHVKPGVGVHR